MDILSITSIFGVFAEYELPIGAPPDLLASIQQFLVASPTVYSLVMQGSRVNVFVGIAPSDTNTPYVVIDGYTEHLPGDSYEDQTINCLIRIVTGGLDQ